MAAYAVINVAAKFAANNRSVLFYGKDKLYEILTNEFNAYTKNNIFGQSFSQYIRNINDKTFFIHMVLGDDFVSNVFKLTHNYNDIEKPWTTRVLPILLSHKDESAFETKSGFSNRGIIINIATHNEQCSHGIIIPAYQKAIVKQVIDDYEIDAENYLEVDNRFIILSFDKGFGMLSEMNTKYIQSFAFKQSERIQQPEFGHNMTQDFKGNWTESFRLKNGEFIHHYPNRIVWGGTSGGTGLIIKMPNYNNMLINPCGLNLITNSAREEFIQSLKDSGIF